MTVRFPGELVAQSVASAPRNIRLADRRGGCAEVGADGGTVFWGGNALCLARGTERTEITSTDPATITRLNDALDRIHGVVGTSVADYPPMVRDFVGFRVMAENSTKHLRPCIFSPDGTLAIIEMAEVLSDGVSFAERPIVSFGVCPIVLSPRCKRLCAYKSLFRADKSREYVGNLGATRGNVVAPATHAVRMRPVRS